MEELKKLDSMVEAVPALELRMTSSRIKAFKFDALWRL